MTALNPSFPTRQHERAAAAAVNVFAGEPGVEAVLLMGSCARGKAAVTSCIDLLVLTQPEGFDAARDRLELRWKHHYPRDQVYQELLALAKFSHIDLDIIDGVFDPQKYDHGWTT